MGHRGDCCGDGVHHLFSAIRGCCLGAASERFRRRVRLELRRDQPCVQPPVVGLGAGEPLCGMAWGPVRGSLALRAWSPSIHCRHDADWHHEQPCGNSTSSSVWYWVSQPPFSPYCRCRALPCGSEDIWESPWGSCGPSREWAQWRCFS